MPSVGSVIPTMIFNRDVLPHPFLPWMLITEDGFNSRLMLDNIGLSFLDKLMFFISSSVSFIIHSLHICIISFFDITIPSASEYT